MTEVRLIPVRLKVPYRSNNAGEVAGFPAPEAAQLLQDGHAEPYQSQGPVQPETAALEGPPVDRMVRGSTRKKA
jgi:hypothetical protein